MIIRNVLTQLENAAAPVAKIIQSSEHFKTFVIGLNKGMIWKEHKTAIPTRLLVVEGVVSYVENEKSVVLHKHDDMQIPINILHSLEAGEDSLCFLIQG